MPSDPTRPPTRYVAVFCGARTGHDPAYAQAARDVGRLLGERGLGLVFGGGRVGLMGIVADAALEAGAPVIGVIPRSMVDKELAHTGCTELHIITTMHERKAMMAAIGDHVAIYGVVSKTVRGSPICPVQSWHG